MGMNENQLLKLNEAAKMLSVTRRTIYNMMNAGTLTKIVLEPGGTRVRADEVYALTTKQGTP